MLIVQLTHSKWTDKVQHRTFFLPILFLFVVIALGVTNLKPQTQGQKSQPQVLLFYVIIPDLGRLVSKWSSLGFFFFPLSSSTQLTSSLFHGSVLFVICLSFALLINLSVTKLLDGLVFSSLYVSAS